MFTVRRYLTPSGKDVFGAWLSELKNTPAHARVLARVARLSLGNFGDCKPLRGGVWELRVNWGPGYRVYYSMIGKTVVLLLCGGDKRKQSADIERAVTYLEDYRRRSA